MPLPRPPSAHPWHYLTVKELAEIASTLFDQYYISGGNETINFPCKEICNIIKSRDGESDVIRQEDDEHDVEKVFKPNEPVVVLWNNEKKECDLWIVFCVCQIDNNTIKVDHIARLIKPGLLG